MLEWINNAVMSLADPLLNWLLRLPTDLALVIVAVGTGAILTFARLLTTNQDLLRRCDEDKKRLKELIREGKRRKDKAAVTRYRATRNMVNVTALKQEGWPLLAAIVPIAILGTWCFQRLAFVPPRADETVAIAAEFPVSVAGDLVHMVPQDGIHEVSAADSGGCERWIQEVVENRDPTTGLASGAVAHWNLQAEARPEPYRLEIRYKEHTVEKELVVGQAVYSPEIEFYGDTGPVQNVQIGMKQVRFLGLVPGIDWLLMPPWLVAYFLIAIPSVSLLKKVMRIY